MAWWWTRQLTRDHPGKVNVWWRKWQLLVSWQWFLNSPGTLRSQMMSQGKDSFMTPFSPESEGYHPNTESGTWDQEVRCASWEECVVVVFILLLGKQTVYLFGILHFYRSEFGLRIQTCLSFVSVWVLLLICWGAWCQLRHSLCPGLWFTKMKIVRVPTLMAFETIRLISWENAEKMLTTMAGTEHSRTDVRSNISRSVSPRSEWQIPPKGVCI